MSERERPAWLIGRISGLVTLAWVMAWALAIAVLGTDRRAFNTLVRLSGNVAMRVILAVVVFAALLHTVDGLGRCLPNGKPERWRAAAWFVAIALGIPAAAVLVWPFLESRVS